ncbi:hypothetical protein Taro_021836 [Colocasia esculenta]|uniref:Phytocyanin domain-containing protein n=1 Tax=Colocasia esculenta TaxID=4460 RepID=A0A843V9F5_COLES|nr:hypothetical protein [Colocasia esculenta]
MASSPNLAILLVLLSILCTLSEAKEFLVGGDVAAWALPPSATSRPLSRWAEANRFQVGDSLVWKYDGKEDSVLQVTREDYLLCNTTNPLAEHRDGSTSVTLSKSGPYYFISGAEGACQKGEKLIVVAMSRRHRHAAAASPAPSPVEAEGPAVAPASGGDVPLVAPLGRGLAAASLGVAVFLGLFL